MKIKNTSYNILKIIQSVRVFIDEIKKEFTKLKLPSKKEVGQSAMILVACVFVAALVLSLLDYLLSFISVLFS